MFRHLSGMSAERAFPALVLLGRNGRFVRDAVVPVFPRIFLAVYVG